MHDIKQFLNFGLHFAEELSMRRSYQYLILCLCLFFALSSFYICFDIYINGSEFDKRKIEFLSRKLELKDLEVQLVKIQSFDGRQQTRGLASVPSVDIDTSKYYFTQIKTLKKNNNPIEALRIAELIKSTSSDSNTLARAEYEKMALQCRDYKVNVECMKSVDYLISQFPDTEWTGYSLVWLAKTYKKARRQTDFKEIVGLIKTDFKHYPQVKKYAQSLTAE